MQFSTLLSASVRFLTCFPAFAPRASGFFHPQSPMGFILQRFSLTLGLPRLRFVPLSAFLRPSGVCSLGESVSLTCAPTAPLLNFPQAVTSPLVLHLSSYPPSCLVADIPSSAGIYSMLCANFYPRPNKKQNLFNISHLGRSKKTFPTRQIAFRI